jgi:membrane associated rhomboid family serine protease
MLLFALLVVGGCAIYFMKPEERINLLRKAVDFLRQGRKAVETFNQTSDPFRDALCERTPRIVVTTAIIALNAAMFVLMVFGAGSLKDPAILVSWGASLGPNTTNGEWWRLVTSLFVHAGFFGLVFSMGALFVLGYVLERLVGPLAFGAVYLVSGMIANLISLASDPLTAVAGSSGAIFGICGLLLATTGCSFLKPSPLSIPLRALKVIGPVAGVFMMFSLLGSTSAESTARLTALAAGIVAGGIFVWNMAEAKPEPPRVAAVAAASAILCLVLAYPVSGTTDIRKDIASVVAFEDRSAKAYDAAVTQFRKGWIKADALISMIDGKIRPELASLRERLKAAKGMPAEQATLAARAEEYFRLRDESWRLRAQALHPPNTKGLKTADRAERASLDVLQGIREADLR